MTSSAVMRWMVYPEMVLPSRTIRSLITAMRRRGSGDQATACRIKPESVNFGMGFAAAGSVGGSGWGAAAFRGAEAAKSCRAGGSDVLPVATAEEAFGSLRGMAISVPAASGVLGAAKFTSGATDSPGPPLLGWLRTVGDGFVSTTVPPPVRAGRGLGILPTTDRTAGMGKFTTLAGAADMSWDERGGLMTMKVTMRPTRVTPVIPRAQNSRGDADVRTAIPADTGSLG